MDKIKYLFAKVCLVFASCRAKSAKDLMNKIIKSSKTATEEIDYTYENFIKRCKQQEKATIRVKRIKSKNTNKPILNIDLDIEHYIVQPDAADKLTRLDMETAITRHRYGDWGEVSIYEWLRNNQAAKESNGVICSRYPLFKGEYFLVKTDKSTRKLTEICMEGSK